jgi:hypothetical protein
VTLSEDATRFQSTDPLLAVFRARSDRREHTVEVTALAKERVDVQFADNLRLRFEAGACTASTFDLYERCKFEVQTKVTVERGIRWPKVIMVHLRSRSLHLL